MRCPVDGAGLVISERNNIEIDYCPECRGIWLDYGELEKIMDGNRRSYDRYDDRDRDRHESRDHDEHRRDDGRGGRKRERGGFLEDVFGGFGD